MLSVSHGFECVVLPHQLTLLRSLTAGCLVTSWHYRGEVKVAASRLLLVVGISTVAPSGFLCFFTILDTTTLAVIIMLMVWL